MDSRALRWQEVYQETLEVFQQVIPIEFVIRYRKFGISVACVAWLESSSAKSRNAAAILDKLSFWLRTTKKSRRILPIPSICSVLNSPLAISPATANSDNTEIPSPARIASLTALVELKLPIRLKSSRVRPLCFSNVILVPDPTSRARNGFLIRISGEIEVILRHSLLFGATSANSSVAKWRKERSTASSLAPANPRSALPLNTSLQAVWDSEIRITLLIAGRRAWSLATLGGSRCSLGMVLPQMVSGPSAQSRKFLSSRSAASCSSRSERPRR